MKKLEVHTVTAPLRKPEHPDVIAVEIVVRVRARGIVDALSKVHSAAPDLMLEEASVQTAAATAGSNAVLAAAREIRSRVVACEDCGLGFQVEDLVGGLCADCQDRIDVPPQPDTLTG